MSNADRCACGHKIVAHGASFAHRGTGACLVGLCQCKVPVEAPQAAPTLSTFNQVLAALRNPSVDLGALDVCRACLSVESPYLHSAETACPTGPTVDVQQPAPSGDEAKVREIANKWYAQYVGSHLPALQHGILPGAVREALAAGKADGAREVDRLKDLINRDKTGLALGLNKIQRIAKGFDWICEGRGPYEYDDDRYRMEVGSLVVQVLAVAKEHLNASGELADEAFHPRAKETVRALADAIARRGKEGA